VPIQKDKSGGLSASSSPARRKNASAMKRNKARAGASADPTENADDSDDSKASKASRGK